MNLAVLDTVRFELVDHAAEPGHCDSAWRRTTGYGHHHRPVNRAGQAGRVS